jgi:hypothetical protein
MDNLGTMTHTNLNSPVELGTRSALILTSVGQDLSLDDLVLLDYALLYSSYFGGPENLHPALPNHVAEVGHRKEYLPQALKLFARRGLISIKHTTTGHYYASNDETLHLISCLKSPYYRKSWTRLNWLSENYKTVIEKSFPTHKAQ